MNRHGASLTAKDRQSMKRRHGVVMVGGVNEEKEWRHYIERGDQDENLTAKSEHKVD